MLTKSNYLSYLRCPKKLWLEKYAPEKAKELSFSQQYFLDEGKRVEQLAKSLFSNAVSIDREAYPADRDKQTKEAINNGSSIILEASFLVDQCFAAVDILQKVNGGWKLIEVKAVSNIEKKHLQDVAFQFYVLKQAGMQITDVNIMYLNKDNEWQGEVNEGLFNVKNVTNDIEPYIASMADTIRQAKILLTEIKPVEAALCRTCFQDGECSFKSYCWKDTKGPTIFDIPMHWKYRDKFTDQNILLLEDIPDDMELEDEIRKAVNRGKNQTVEIDMSAIKKWLDNLNYPLYFMDFETYGPAIPIFKGMKPYQRIPFQFSCHILDEDGNMQHKEFLHKTNSDPRRAFIDALTNVIGPFGSIIVYHQSFEKGVLKGLQLMASDEKKSKLKNYIDRLTDLEDIFKNHYIHHAFKGSTSIKAVLPVLCPELSYKNLEIQKGDQASIAWLDVINGNNKQKTAANLEKYCELDTYAMLAIYKKLICEIGV